MTKKMTKSEKEGKIMSDALREIFTREEKITPLGRPAPTKTILKCYIGVEDEKVLLKKCNGDKKARNELILEIISDYVKNLK